MGSVCVGSGLIGLFVIGAENAVIERDGEVYIALTYMTETLSNSTSGWPMLQRVARALQMPELFLWSAWSLVPWLVQRSLSAFRSWMPVVCCGDAYER
jgi:hypothetical protein